MTKRKSPRQRFHTRELTHHLLELAAEAHDWTEADGVITRGEALARLLWRKALGWDEDTLDETGREVQVKHQPEAWAIQLIYERMEGKTPQSMAVDEGRVKAVDKVRALAANRINAATTQVSSTAELPPIPES